MSTTVSDHDHGYAALMREIDKNAGSKGYVLTVGIHEEEGGEGDGSATAAEVAEWNEFGTENIPARPAITGWADTNETRVLSDARGILAKSITKGRSPAVGLDQLAQRCAGEMQAAIAAGVPPPNAPSTIAKKGSSTPLVNTGQFRSSIRGKVKSGD